MPHLEMTDVLGDEEVAAVVYIDHNLGTLVKDAFAGPEPIDHVGVEQPTGHLEVDRP